MKVLLISGGFFIIIFICLAPLKRDIQEYEVQKYGQLITAMIRHIPLCKGTKVRYFMQFNYEGRQFDKKVGCGFANTHKVGDAIKLKHIDGTDIFLFEDENKKKEFISTALLGLFGIVSIVAGIRQK